MLLSCLSRPNNSRKGCSNNSSVCEWLFILKIKSSVLFAISSNCISSVPAISDEEGSLACFSIKSKTNQGFKSVLVVLQPISRSPLIPNVYTMMPTILALHFFSLEVSFSNIIFHLYQVQTGSN